MIFSILESITQKPDPFAKYTANELWTDEHTSRHMLEFHLNGDVDISSRRTAFIEESVSWMTEHFALCERNKIIDFGCGPGLYTSRFARLGAEVCGVDFSSRSIAYARHQATKSGDRTTYIETDYLEYKPEGQYDLITMIMCDYCALAPSQRSSMLEKFRSLLSEGGRVVLDVYSLRGFDSRQGTLEFGKDLMNGFWSPNPYFGFLASFKYDDDNVSLDKYTIIEEDSLRECYNWLHRNVPGNFGLDTRQSQLALLLVGRAS